MFCMFNLNVSKYDTQNTLMRVYLQCGSLVFGMFAACCGCDFTTKASGELAGVGPPTLLEVLEQMM